MMMQMPRKGIVQSRISSPFVDESSISHHAIISLRHILGLPLVFPITLLKDSASGDNDRASVTVILVQPRVIMSATLCTSALGISVTRVR